MSLTYTLQISFFFLFGLWLCIGSPQAAVSIAPADKGSAPSPAIPLPELEKMAGAMIMMGFRGMEFAPGDPFLEAVRSGMIRNVILFARDIGSGGARNISSSEQVRHLTQTLRQAAPGPMLIAVDQEGGRVRRLKPREGVIDLPSAKALGRGTPQNTQVLAVRLGLELAALGINVNLAPTVDVDMSPGNPIIGGLERSFSPDPALVSKHGQAFARGMFKAGIIPVLKHFPGHGKADGDSYSGTADITARWSSTTDLKPYVDAFQAGWAGMVMIGHLRHRGLDPVYPATLSALVVNSLLRSTLGWDGVVITDDMQMGGVADRYALDQSIALAVNAGCDILLFGNNLNWDPDLPRTVHATLVRLVREGKIPPDRIRQSWQRIQKLYAQHVGQTLEAEAIPQPLLIRIQ